MPCFDPKDVIFITNKWDTIYNEEGLEDEISLTWEAFLSDIKRIWPFVKEENVFRLNLKEVTTNSIFFIIEIKFYDTFFSKSN